MKLCKLTDITGSVKLARPILKEDYTELLSAGTILRPEYVSRLAQLGITEVYIEENVHSKEEVQILKNDVEDKFKEKVRSVIERHVYNNSSELEELSKTADSIISSILENDEVVEQIFDIRERSADIYEHSISVCSMSIIVAAKLRLTKREMHNLGVACLFHDIGLRYLDFSYINRMLADMNPREQSEYRKHPAYAYSALERENWISGDSKLMILQHHERMDGSGFPLKIKRPDICSQILEVVDAFDELICGIGCRRAHVYEAIEFLKVFKGTKFSKETVEVMLDLIAVYPSGTVVSLNTGEQAQVVKQNKGYPERPVLNILRDKSGKEYINGKICDLMKERTVFIEDVIV